MVHRAVTLSNKVFQCYVEKNLIPWYMFFNQCLIKVTLPIKVFQCYVEKKLIQKIRLSVIFLYFKM